MALSITEKEHSDLPSYLRVLFNERDTAHFNYQHCRTQANNITYIELDAICSIENSIFRKSGTIDQPNSLSKYLGNVDEAIRAGYLLYSKNNEQRYMDLLVGLEQVKEIIKEISQLKMNEYKLVSTMNMNEYNIVRTIIENEDFASYDPMEFF